MANLRTFTTYHPSQSEWPWLLIVKVIQSNVAAVRPVYVLLIVFHSYKWLNEVPLRRTSL